MSIKITRGNITITVDTEDELRTVLKMIDNPKSRVSLNPKDAVADSDTLYAVYQSIPENSTSGQVLRVLSNNINGASTSQIMDTLKLSSPQALGGAIGNIGRRAKEFGVDAEDIYMWEPMRDVYKLTPTMSEAIIRIKSPNERE